MWGQHHEMNYASLSYDNLDLDGFPAGGVAQPGETHKSWRKIWKSKEITFDNPSQLSKVYSVNISYHIPKRFEDLVFEDAFGVADQLPEYTNKWEIAVFFEWVDKNGVYYPADMGPEVIQPQYWNEIIVPSRGGGRLDTRDLNANTGFLGILDNVQEYYEEKDYLFKAKVNQNVYSCWLVLATTTQGNYFTDFEQGGVTPGMYFNDMEIVYRNKTIK